MYVFLTTINTWAILCSKEAVAYMNALMGMDSIQLSHVGAFEPFVHFTERHATDNVADTIPMSICIGCERLRVSFDSDGLSLSKCTGVVKQLPTTRGYSTVSSLCYMSLDISQWPSRWNRTSNYAMYKFLAPLFVDPLELKTVEWCIGQSLLDPHSYSKAVILYGEGGHGKSTFLAALNIALMGACNTIQDSALVSLSKGLSPEMAATVVSSRIVTAGDVGKITDETNLSVVKTLTGHDYVSVPPSRAKSACTLFYSSNRLDNPLENTEWASAAIMRRVVVVYMNAQVIEGLEDSVPQDMLSRLDFALRCVHTRLTNPCMPVTLLSVVLTITGSQYEEVVKKIGFVESDDIDEHETLVANSIIAAYVGVTAEKVGQLARKISTSCVRTIRGKYYIAGIVPMPDG